MQQGPLGSKHPSAPPGNKDDIHNGNHRSQKQQLADDPEKPLQKDLTTQDLRHVLNS